MGVMAAAEAVEAFMAVAVFLVVAIVAAAITQEDTATAAITAGGMVTAAAGTEVHRREGPDLEDLVSEDLGTLGVSPPVIERQLLTGGGIRLEETAVGSVEATALAVALAFVAASVNAAFLEVVGSASAAGAADLGLALVGGSVGIPSGIGHRTGIAPGGDTIIHRIPIRTSSRHFSAGSGVLVERLSFSRQAATEAVAAWTVRALVPTRAYYFPHEHRGLDSRGGCHYVTIY